MEELERRGIGFRSLTEAIDTTMAGGKLIFHIFAALAALHHPGADKRGAPGGARTGAHRGKASSAAGKRHSGGARALLQDPEITVAQVAKRLGVVASTPYRHFLGGRGAVGK